MSRTKRLFRLRLALYDIAALAQKTSRDCKRWEESKAPADLISLEQSLAELRSLIEEIARQEMPQRKIPIRFPNEAPRLASSCELCNAS